MNRGERLGRLAEAIAADRGRTFDVPLDRRLGVRRGRVPDRDSVRSTGAWSRRFPFRRRVRDRFVPLVIVLVLMVGAFYLLLWRPQQRRIAMVRALQSQLQEGDEVLTTSGIYGRVTVSARPTPISRSRPAP